MGFRPIFEKGLILKQHMLEALRDYPYDFVSAVFSGMGDGIIEGLEISIPDENHFCISEGIVKTKGKIYFITQKTLIKAERETNYVYLEIVSRQEADGTVYDTKIIQKKEEDLSLFELFRYVRNAVMKDYGDIKEIFIDTANRVDRRKVLKSVLGGSTLCGSYYRLFAQYLLRSGNSGMEDIAFAYQCLNGIHSIDMVKAYFKTEDTENDKIISLMKDRIIKLESLMEKVPAAKPERKQERKMIIS